jgi:hypothetical protein
MANTRVVTEKLTDHEEAYAVHVLTDDGHTVIFQCASRLRAEHFALAVEVFAFSTRVTGAA